MAKPRTRDNGGRWEYARIYGPAVLLGLLALVVAYQFVGPPPPDRITIATGSRQGAYFAFAERYREILARDGVTVEVRETQGSVENIALLESPENRVQAYLAAGHVCTVMGWQEYMPIAEKYGVPMVVSGFEPVDILSALLMVVQQLEDGRNEVINAYPRSVGLNGNPAARKVMFQVFEVCDRQWRGIGNICASGLAISAEFAAFDAEKRYGLENFDLQESGLCQSGLVLMGQIKPPACPAFAKECTPATPLGATMVSGEGACAAYYKYHRGAK